MAIYLGSTLVASGGNTTIDCAFKESYISNLSSQINTTKTAVDQTKTAVNQTKTAVDQTKTAVNTNYENLINAINELSVKIDNPTTRSLVNSSPMFLDPGEMSPITLYNHQTFTLPFPCAVLIDTTTAATTGIGQPFSYLTINGGDYNTWKKCWFPTKISNDTVVEGKIYLPANTQITLESGTTTINPNYVEFNIIPFFDDIALSDFEGFYEIEATFDELKSLSSSTSQLKQYVDTAKWHQKRVNQMVPWTVEMTFNKKSTAYIVTCATKISKTYADATSQTGRSYRTYAESLMYKANSGIGVGTIIIDFFGVTGTPSNYFIPNFPPDAIKNDKITFKVIDLSQFITEESST